MWLKNEWQKSHCASAMTWHHGHCHFWNVINFNIIPHHKRITKIPIEIKRIPGVIVNFNEIFTTNCNLNYRQQLTSYVLYASWLPHLIPCKLYWKVNFTHCSSALSGFLPFFDYRFWGNWSWNQLEWSVLYMPYSIEIEFENHLHLHFRINSN